ncbi:MAG: restriction endonuclease subunit S [Lysobacterales bacterium]
MGTREVPFTALISQIVDNRGKTCPTADAGIPLIATNCIRNELLYPTYEKARFVSPETYSTWFRGHPKPGDILFVNKATPGRVCLVPDPVDFCIAQDMVAVRANPSKVYPKYLFAALRSPIAQERISRMHVGSLIPHLKKGDFDKLFLPLPGSDEQRFIGDLYFELSAKIDLNRRMNAALEAMARALFQSWFVDFDPVRAKLDGRQPVGLDSATAALFPARFDETAAGHIPHGWTATTLGDACARGGGNIQTGPFGTQLHASDYVDEGIPSIMPSDLRDNRIETSSIARIREQDAERLAVYRVQVGDVVYSRRGDVERRSLIRRNEHGWLCGTGCLRVRFGSSGLNPFFGASCLGTPESRAWVVRHAVGATMPNLNTSILGALPMVIPPPELQSRFAEIVAPWDKRGTIALEQSSTLATLRDTLLPKFLSGEVKPTSA